MTIWWINSGAATRSKHWSMCDFLPFAPDAERPPSRRDEHLPVGAELPEERRPRLLAPCGPTTPSSMRTTVPSRERPSPNSAFRSPSTKEKLRPAVSRSTRAEVEQLVDHDRPLVLRQDAARRDVQAHEGDFGGLAAEAKPHSATVEVGRWKPLPDNSRRPRALRQHRDAATLVGHLGPAPSAMQDLVTRGYAALRGDSAINAAKAHADEECQGKPAELLRQRRQPLRVGDLAVADHD